MADFVFDAFEFCRLGEHREGEIAVADMPRLAKEVVDTSGTIRWSLQGGRDERGHPRLSMSVAGVVRLMCQRCLTPFEHDVTSEAVLVLARDEADIDAIESLIDDDSVDVIAGSHEMNSLDLIEDEVLLALPLSPRHDVCPDPQAGEALKKAGKESPFAVLKDLKK